MGLFGEIDADDIPDNPFYVAPGTYECILTEAKRVSKKSGDGEGLSFKWQIEDEDNEYNGQNISDWKNIYPDATASDMTPQIKADASRLKMRLIEMGLTSEDMEVLLDDENLAELVGLRANVTVTETADKNDPDKKYTNVQKVNVEAV